MKTSKDQLFTLTHNDEVIFTGTENECYFKLQRIQGQSADWAIKYEGYKISENTIDVTTLFTRKDYLDGKCTHSQYYAQFVDEYVLHIVNQRFGKQLSESTDIHLNDIPLAKWDMLANVLYSHSSNAKLRELGDYPTLAGRVCILKEAAKQIIEANKI